MFSGVLMTMLLDLSKLHGQREHLERTFQPSLFEPQDEDYRVATPVELSLDVEKAGSGVFLVSGRAVTRLQLECGRCLDEVEVPVDARFELRYMPEESAAGAALPMKPLCAQSCRGLCPECGANLNRTECGCQPKWEDPRLAPLKGLLNREKEN